MDKLIAIIVAVALCACLVACTGEGKGSSVATSESSASEAGGSSARLEQQGYTQLVPGEYKMPADEQGSVTRIEYGSLDYVRDGAPITKEAYVYAPFGYGDDPDTRYDVVYLMHGWGGHAGEYFDYTATKNVLDHMIANGDIPPAIFVSPTFYNASSDTGFGGSVAELRMFHQDFEENLMPAVEGQFRTYAASTSREDLAASRAHRVFGGFSLGAVTTWLEFCHDFDYISGFLPMSGSCWYYGTYGDFQIERNVDYLEQLVTENDLDARGYFIYHAVGTDDAVKSQSVDMAREMLSRDVFTFDHYVFYQKEGGRHDLDAVQEYLYNALPALLKSVKTARETSVRGESEAQQVSFEPYAAETRIDDVESDPALGDWGRLLFPVNKGYMGGSTLGSMSLTWYGAMDPGMTVDICNYVKDRALAGETVFIDIYTDREKAADPRKADTGLFFFKGDEGAPTAIVNAGGGFSYVGAMHDSFPHCMELARRGYNAFALIYRPGAQTACEDLARAIAYLHEHADELGISMEGYSLWGGSAGGRMAAWLGAHGTESFKEAAYPRPAACITNYTGLNEVTGDEPPTYSAVGTADGIASWRTVQERIERIRANGTPAEIEVFDGMPHGFGLGTGTVAEGWLDRAVKFWEKNR